MMKKLMLKDMKVDNERKFKPELLKSIFIEFS